MTFSLPGSNESIDAKEWVVSRHRHDLRQVRISAPEGAVPSFWLAQLRRLYPPLQQRTPAELLNEARSTQAIDLGVMAGREAFRLTQELQRHGFILRVQNASYISHSPQVRGGGLIIEDAAENEAFCLQLIQAGAIVVEHEAEW
ncbi:MAG: hypothetical protein ACO1TE_15430 [Prosthecobacter sp.]